MAAGRTAPQPTNTTDTCLRWLECCAETKATKPPRNISYGVRASTWGWASEQIPMSAQRRRLRLFAPTISCGTRDSRVSPIALESIQEVAFFKRDELTTDLVCCEIIARGEGGVVTWFFHEEAPEWGDVLALLEQLPGFDREWASKVLQPPFAENRTVVFQRPAECPLLAKSRRLAANPQTPPPAPSRPAGTALPAAHRSSLAPRWPMLPCPARGTRRSRVR